MEIEFHRSYFIRYTSSALFGRLAQFVHRDCFSEFVHTVLFASVLPGMRPLLLIGGCPKYPPSCRSPGSAFQPTVRTACFRLTVRNPIPCVRALLSVIPYSILAYSRSAETPFVLFALLLLSAPDGFTFRSLFAFDGFGERTGVNIDRLPYRIGMFRSI